MTKVVRMSMLVLFVLVAASSLFVTGCTRYANEEQLTMMDESDASAVASEMKVAELEKEKAALQAELDAKKAEFEKIKAEMAKVQAGL